VLNITNPAAWRTLCNSRNYQTFTDTENLLAPLLEPCTRHYPQPDGCIKYAVINIEHDRCPNSTLSSESEGKENCTLTLKYFSVIKQMSNFVVFSIFIAKLTKL